MPLSNDGGFFDSYLRRCAQCGKTTDKPSKIELGNGKVTEHCLCGGELKRV